MVADADELRRALTLFADPGHACELRSVPSGVHKTLPGADLDGLCSAAHGLPGGIGVYFIINPVPVGLSSPAKNGDIVARRWLYIDVDPVKEESNKDNPASDSEKGRTSTVCDSVNEYLRGCGWPAPVITDSGNGFGMFYRCDLSNDKLVQATYRNVLADLAKRFSGPDGLIDKAIHNASRLAKLPGTWARKGVQSDDRPHRPCKLLFVPECLGTLTFEQLKAASGTETPEPTEPPPTLPFTLSTNGTGHKRDEAYGRKAMDAECARVVLSQRTDEGRNNALNRAAFSLGTLVGGGVLMQRDVEERLFQAACQSGLDRDDGGIRGIYATIASGLRAGMASPRGVPEGKADPAVKIGQPSKGEKVDPAEPLTVSLSKIVPVKIDWLIKDRIPKRFITVFAGRTGVGKSFVSHDLIARLSTGGEIPFGKGECFTPGGTLILSEDSHEYVLAPRLIEAGADLTRVNAMTWKAMSRYSLGDTDMLTQACAEVPGGVSLVMIDPPTNFLADTDEHKNSEVRQLVMKVVEWAFGRDLAVLFILHVNKQSGKGVEALNRVMGSVAWVTTARIAHTLCIRPEDPSQCLWVPLKNNLGVLAKALAYKITPTGSGSAKVEWVEEVDMSAEEAMGHAEPKPRRDVVASEWLIEQFREKREWPSDELFKNAKEVNINRDAMFEAKKLLDLPKARKVTQENGNVVWCWWVPENWPPLTPEPDEEGK